MDQQLITSFDSPKIILHLCCHQGLPMILDWFIYYLRMVPQHFLLLSSFDSTMLYGIHKQPFFFSPQFIPCLIPMNFSNGFPV